MTDRDKIEQEAEARIVAWLRDQQENALLRPMPKFWSQSAGAWQARVMGRHDAFETAADAIARREHLPADMEGGK